MFLAERFLEANKVRNSHKPRLGEYVQQGNIRSITYIIRGGFFHLLFKKIVSKKRFEKDLSLKIFRV